MNADARSMRYLLDCGSHLEQLELGVTTIAESEMDLDGNVVMKSHLALKAEGTPIETLRRIRSFVESDVPLEHNPGERICTTPAGFYGAPYAAGAQEP